MFNVEIIYDAKEIDSEKVAALDMVGTLLEKGEMPATNYAINTAMGIDPELENQTYCRHRSDSGGMEDSISHASEISTYLDSVERNNNKTDLETYTKVIQDLINDREILDGAGEFIESLESQGYDTVVVSSAPQAFTIPYADELGISKVYSWKDLLFEGQDFLGRYVDPEAREGKQQFVQKLQEQGTEVMFVGNGGNDEGAAAQADTSFIQKSWKTDPEQNFEAAIKKAEL